jgi:hypothetical protein
MPRDVHTWAEAGANIAKTLRAGRAGVPRDLEKIGLHLVNSIRLEVSQPGQGRVYYTYFFTKNGKVVPRGTRMIPHRASAPYEPPAVDTGALRASYGHNVKRMVSGGTLTVGSGSEYAPLLEYGTSRMAPRPHLRPQRGARCR